MDSPNPFEAPRSNVGRPRNGRPLLVWLICSFLSAGLGLMIWNEAAFISGILPFDDAAREAMKRRTSIDVLFQGLKLTSYALAIVALFRLRRDALYLFVLVLIVDIVHLAYRRLADPQFHSGFGQYWWLQGVFILVPACVVAYVYYLRVTARLHA